MTPAGPDPCLLPIVLAGARRRPSCQCRPYPTALTTLGGLYQVPNITAASPGLGCLPFRKGGDGGGQRRFRRSNSKLKAVFGLAQARRSHDESVPNFSKITAQFLRGGRTSGGGRGRGRPRKRLSYGRRTASPHLECLRG